MNFEKVFKQTLLIFEADEPSSITGADKPEDEESVEPESITGVGDEQEASEDNSVDDQEPEVVGETPEDVQDTDDLIDDEEESALGMDGDSPTSPEVANLIELTNLLIKSLKFNPTKEFKAYINMPKYFNLSTKNKILTIQSAINKHPERLLQEAGGVDDFGDDEIDGEAVPTGKTKNEQDIVKLIVKAMNTNPNVMGYTLSKIPSKATASNYEEVLIQIDNALF